MDQDEHDAPAGMTPLTPQSSPTSQRATSLPTERWARWQHDINELKAQVTNLYERQLVWKAYTTSLKQIEMIELASILHDWMIHNYSDAMTIGIRRLIDRGTTRNEPVSLHELITDISDHVADITVANYVAVWHPRDQFEESRAVSAFTQLFPDGLPTQDSLRKEAELIRASADTILVHADKRIAHTDRDRPAALPKWRDLDDALELVAKVFRRYFLLITCGEYFLDMMIMPFGWDAAIERACLASVQRPTPRSP
jgi:hypothetical protein